MNNVLGGCGAASGQLRGTAGVRTGHRLLAGGGSRDPACTSVPGQMPLEAGSVETGWTLSREVRVMAQQGLVLPECSFKNSGVERNIAIHGWRVRPVQVSVFTCISHPLAWQPLSGPL